MSYEPKTWECGDVITAEDLNHLEQGVANCGGGTEPLIITLTGDVIAWNDADTETSDTDFYAYTDKTLSELAEAFDSGRPCIFVYEETHDSSEQDTIEISNRRPYGRDLVVAYAEGTVTTFFTGFSTLDIVKSEHGEGYTLERDDNPTADATTLVVECDLV